MIKYSGIGDQMTTGISDQVLRNTQSYSFHAQQYDFTQEKASIFNDHAHIHCSNEKSLAV
ncbi:TPA: hypothetical protein JBD00_12895 [Legionella pneumophila subsp. pneumophila]|nr:hypothetical protein [Legionella pneumophila subsp. pneumophila]